MKRRRRPTLAELAKDLAAGKVTAVQLAEEALARIADPAGEGARAFIHVDAGKVKTAAAAQDDRRRKGQASSLFAGIPFGIKDIFDVAGEVTRVGSKLLASAPVAPADSDAVAAMKGQGFVALGRTNMTEFAYSGVGLNPHYGTPLSVYGRNERRIPGGSSSGSAVAVADGLCAVALGTDTGGSCRIPAAFNGIVGFKPSAQRVSRRGVYPLSASFDSVGPLGNSVACCAAVDAILAGAASLPVFSDPGTFRIGVLDDYVLTDRDAHVARDFEAARAALARAGHVVQSFRFPALAGLPDLLSNGGIVAAQAFAQHAPLIAAHGAEYDPRVVSRIRFGDRTDAAELQRVTRARQEMIAAFAAAASGFNAILCPTVPVIPPRLDEFVDDGAYRRLNAMALRNTYVFNFLDACAISLPMHGEGAPPTGLMLARPNGGDAALFQVAAAVEALI